MDIVTLEAPAASDATVSTGAMAPVVTALAERGRRAAIGSFDGVHLGHRGLIGGCDTVVTFDPHPTHVLENRRPALLLSDLTTRLRRLEQLGVRRVAVICFNRAWTKVSAEDFASRVLIEELGCSRVRVGAGFRFGAHGAGTAETLQNSGLDVEVRALREESGEPISSSRIRRLVEEGDVSRAVGLLGAPLTLPYVRESPGVAEIPHRFAVPPPGLYLGRVQGHAIAVRVLPDHRVELDSTVDTEWGNYVALTKQV